MSEWVNCRGASIPVHGVAAAPGLPPGRHRRHRAQTWFQGSAPATGTGRRQHNSGESFQHTWTLQLIIVSREVFYIHLTDQLVIAEQGSTG